MKMTDGSEDEFDTVLAAVGTSCSLLNDPSDLLPHIFPSGRYADSPGLNLDAVGVRTDPKNGKIICVNEQTSVPNIYAVGDVVQGVPELTPAAIKVSSFYFCSLVHSLSWK